ncbi:MAG: IS982 family transposase, partial [Anaerolineae bacterium]
GMSSHTIGLGDKAFLDEETQRMLQQEYDLYLLTPIRSNMRPTPFMLPPALKGIRQKVETVISQLTERFKIQSMRVRKGWTLLAKWFRKILAHTICVWLNLQYGRPPLDFAGLVSVK